MNLRAARLYNKISRSPRKLLSKRLRPGELVADVGGGDMFKSFLYIYQPAQNQRIVCVERFEDRTIYGDNVLPRHITENPHFSLRATDIDEEPLPFSEGEVDGVFLSHVIEHVKDRAYTLREIHRVLKPGGYLYVETPGERSLMVPKDSKLKTGSNSYPYHFLDDPTHIGEPYSRASLNGSIEAAGFAIERAGFYREFGSVAMPFYAFFFLCSYLPLLPAKYRSVLRGFGWWNMVGWSIYSFARKPSAVTKKAS